MTTYENIRVTGYERGREEAHNVTLTFELARQYINGTADDPDELAPPAPLSGEWAGESMPELLGELADDPDAADDYEEGFDQGWEDTLTARAHDIVSA